MAQDYDYTNDRFSDISDFLERLHQEDMQNGVGQSESLHSLAKLSNSDVEVMIKKRREENV